MSQQLRKTFLLILLLVSASFCFSQSREIKIKFIGNCGLQLTDGKSTLYVDFPYKSGAYNYMTYELSVLDSIPDNAYFLFTHTHADHYSKRIVKRMIKLHKGKAYGSWNAKKHVELSNSFDDFKIESIKTKHRFTTKHYSYLITWHGKRIFLSGDTESAETIVNYKQLNWAFVPTWIIMDAKAKQLKIEAEKFGIYHLYPNQRITNSDPAKYMLLNKQGEVFSISY